jgi:hypothetical protein
MSSKYGGGDPRISISQDLVFAQIRRELAAKDAEIERLTRERDAARMMIGPLSQRPDLLDATEDVVGQIERLRAENQRLVDDYHFEHNLKVANTDLRAENERLKAALKQAEDANLARVLDNDLLAEANTEIDRLKREVDYWMNLDAAALERDNERLRAALTEIMQGSRSLDYAIHVARVALANDKAS